MSVETVLTIAFGLFAGYMYGTDRREADLRKYGTSSTSVAFFAVAGAVVFLVLAELSRRYWNG